MNNKQLAIIFKPICNDQIIMYLIAKQLRTMWFKQKQQQLFKVYKKYQEVANITQIYNKYKNNIDIYRLEDNRSWYGYRWRTDKHIHICYNLPAAIMYMRIYERYDNLQFIPVPSKIE